MELRKRPSPTPPKITRPQPTGSPHMATRAAAKAASFNGSISGSISTRSGSSRRSSFNDRPARRHSTTLASEDVNSARSPKRRRLSTNAKTTPTQPSQPFKDSSSGSRRSTRSVNGTLPPITERPAWETPRPRKRSHRSSNATEEMITVALPASRSTEPNGVKQDTSVSPESTLRRSLRTSERIANIEIDVKEGDGGSSEDLAHPPVSPAASKSQQSSQSDNSAGEVSVSTSKAGAGKVDGPLRRSSRHSGYSDESQIADAYDNAIVSDHSGVSAPSAQDEDVVTKEDIMEHANEDVDVEKADAPVSDEEKSIEASQVEADEPLPPSTAEQSPNKVSQLAVIEPGKVAKRLPGRRRAPHPIARVEAALRRQLHLRMSYRAVAKQLKPILAELSKRSLKDLKTKKTAHEEAREAKEVRSKLQEGLKKRLQTLQEQHQLNVNKLQKTLDVESENRKEQRQVRRITLGLLTHADQIKAEVNLLRDELVAHLQHDFVKAVRARDQDGDEHATDDEGNEIVPPLHRISKKNHLTILPAQYDSRSRPTMETERLFDQLHARSLVDKIGQQLDPELYLRSGPFTTMDPTHRETMEAKRKIAALIKAFQEAEEKRQSTLQTRIKAIRNEEAVGLQMLASASTKHKADPPVSEPLVKTESVRSITNAVEHSPGVKQSPTMTPSRFSNHSSTAQSTAIRTPNQRKAQIYGGRAQDHPSASMAAATESRNTSISSSTQSRQTSVTNPLLPQEPSRRSALAINDIIGRTDEDDGPRKRPRTSLGGMDSPGVARPQPSVATHGHARNVSLDSWRPTYLSRNPETHPAHSRHLQTPQSPLGRGDSRNRSTSESVGSLLDRPAEERRAPAPWSPPYQPIYGARSFDQYGRSHHASPTYGLAAPYYQAQGTPSPTAERFPTHAMPPPPPQGYGLPQPSRYQHYQYVPPHIPQSFPPPPPAAYSSATTYQGVPPPPHQTVGPPPYGAVQQQQYGAGPPPLRPGPDVGRGSAASPPQTTPAFAQYQQQSGQKRRRQSSSGQDRFQHYHPPFG